MLEKVMKSKRNKEIQNKYNLTIAKLKQYKVGDRSKIGEPRFWRNNVIDAWCISDSVDRYGSGSYWIGIYDEDAPSYKGKFKFHFSCMDDMCSYNFTKFFKPDEIENDYDLWVQEHFLDTVNNLIEDGIIVCPNEKMKN